MNVIRCGLEANIDVSWYAKKRFNYEQMLEIYIGLIMKIDVSKYATNKYNAKQMMTIRKKLENEQKNT